MSRREKIVTTVIQQAMEQKGLVAEPYTVAQRVNGKKPKVTSLRENLIRISEHDPIDFLLRIMAGENVRCKYIDGDGEEHVEFIPVPVKERISIAKFLTSKIMPQMHVVKELKDGDPDADDGKDGFEALVDEAIGRGKRKQIEGSAAVLGKKPN